MPQTSPKYHKWIPERSTSKRIIMYHPIICISFPFIDDLSHGFPPYVLFYISILSSDMAQGISKRLAADAVVALVECTEFGDPETPETPETGAVQMYNSIVKQVICEQYVNNMTISINGQK